MKKIAFYVEGQTEQFFINKLLIEIAGQKNIEIELQQFQGIGRKAKSDIYPKTTSNAINPNHHALIFDCMGDGGVKPRILDDYQRLFSQGYSEVIGLLDLYPKENSDLNKFENELLNGRISKNGRVVTQPLPTNTKIVVAVKEVESWFLAECTHFQEIDNNLTISHIESNLGFNPCVDDMTQRFHPADDLKKIYQLVGKTYNKSENNVQRTVECLDYANIYLNLPAKITKLNELISKIDAFLV